MNRKARKHVQAASKLLFGTSVPPETQTHHLSLSARIKQLLSITADSGISEEDQGISDEDSGTSEEDKLKALTLAARKTPEGERELWSASRSTREYSNYRPDHVRAGQCIYGISRRLFEKLESNWAKHVEFAKMVESDTWFVVHALLDPELENDFTSVCGYWGKQYFPNSYYLLGRHYIEKDGTVRQIYVQLSSNGIVCDTPAGFRNRGWIDANDYDKKTLNGLLFNFVVSEAIKKPRELIKELKDAEGLSVTGRKQIKARIEKIRKDHNDKMKRLSQKLGLSDDYYSTL